DEGLKNRSMMESQKNELNGYEKCYN
ncbi:hypothetical protein BMETH_711131513931668, partial [methanotrophic bacterial endosymbiont of Bathymodiolus sp.]